MDLLALGIDGGEYYNVIQFTRNSNRSTFHRVYSETHIQTKAQDIRVYLKFQTFSSRSNGNEELSHLQDQSLHSQFQKNISDTINLFDQVCP